MMRIQKQPNRWSCLPTAFAMTLNISVEKVISELGHDGSEIIWPELPDPYCRRAFHPQELVYFCYLRHVHVIEFQAMPSLIPPLSEGVTPFVIKNHMEFLLTRRGVLTGQSGKNNHAVAWDGKYVYDPNGTMYDIQDFTISSFWLTT